MQKTTKLVSFISFAIVLGVASYFVALAFFESGVNEEVSVIERATTTLTRVLDNESEPVSSIASTSIDQQDVRVADAVVSGSEDVAPATVQTDSGQRETVTLAGGCFWCTEAYLQETPGVVSAVSGYAGGNAATADYKTVSRGNTEHREAVQVVFDPVRVNFVDILESYWSHIDPTDEGGQFADRGFHYTTAIYYHSEAQRVAAETSKQALSESGLFEEAIQTEILPYSTFFEAEEYHQDYYQKASAHYERYKKASGRAGFIEDNWAKEAALQFFEEAEDTNINTVSVSEATIDQYVKKEWTDSEIQAGLATLSPEVYRILALDGTEPRFDNEYYDKKDAGIYVDVVTGRPLYSSTHKYDSGTGWPAFYRPIAEENLIYETDFKLITPRTEVRSESGHLGHVFTDGPEEHGGKRHCINSLALNFVPLAEMSDRGYADWLYLFGEA